VLIELQFNGRRVAIRADAVCLVKGSPSGGSVLVLDDSHLDRVIEVDNPFPEVVALVNLTLAPDLVDGEEE
jgi:hypothetical protein